MDEVPEKMSGVLPARELEIIMLSEVLGKNSCTSGKNYKFWAL